MEKPTERVQNRQAEPPDCLPFNPNATSRWRNLELSPIPRYLFRVTTPKSEGSTGGRWAKSKDALSTPKFARTCIFQTSDVKETAELIKDHLTQFKRHGMDNLVSWTSSILFAIQYIIYRHLKLDSDLEDIQLFVVDTERFEKRVFIKDMDLLEAFGEHNSKLRELRTLRKGPTYYFGEYLSQGALKIHGKCQSVSAKVLVAKGLLELHPNFRASHDNTTKHEWAKAVVKVRESLNEEHSATISLQQSVVAFRLANLFAEGFRIGVYMSLMALLPGEIDSEIVQEAFRGRGLEKTEITDYAWTLEDQPKDSRMPEITRVRLIAQLVLADFAKLLGEERLQHDVLSLCGTVEGLSLLKRTPTQWSSLEKDQILESVGMIESLGGQIREMFKEDTTESGVSD